MRSLLLASAAVLITAGVACAQTASPTPAPTGSMGEPTATGSAAGRTAPNPAATGSMSQSSMSSSNAGTSTVPNSKSSTGNAGEMATKSDPVATGSTGMSSGSSGMSSMNTGMTHTHHMWSGTMPQDADAHTYLKIASMAIKQHDKATADEALNRAETRMLTRSVPASGSMMDDSAGVKAVENARQAVDAGNFHEAMMDTDMAMHHHMMGGSGMGASGGMSDSSDMSNSPSMGNQSSGSTMPGQGTSSPGMSAGAASGTQQ